MGAEGCLTLSVKDRGLTPSYQKESSGLPTTLVVSALEPELLIAAGQFPSPLLCSGGVLRPSVS